MAQEDSVIELRVSNLESTVNEIREAVKSIDRSMQTFARLEVHHSETRDALGRAFAEIEELKKEQREYLKDHETRIRMIEQEMPTTKLVRGWIIAGVIGLVAIVGMAIVADRPGISHSHQESINGR